MSQKFIIYTLVVAFLGLMNLSLIAQQLEKPLPDDFDKHWNRALQLYKNAEYAEAIKIYRELIQKLNPGEIRGACYYNIACCELKLGREKEGLLNLFLAVKDGFRDLETIKNDEDLKSVRENKLFKYLCELMQNQKNDVIDKLTLEEIESKFFPEDKDKPQVTPRPGTINFSYNVNDKVIDAKFYSNRKYSEEEQKRLIPMLKNYANTLVNQAKQNPNLRVQLFRGEENYNSWVDAGMPFKLYIISTNETFDDLEFEFNLGEKQQPEDEFDKLKKEFKDSIDKLADELKKEFLKKKDENLDKLKESFKPLEHPKKLIVNPYLGIRAEELTTGTRLFFGLPEGIGILVSSVTPGSPAELAGFQPFDALLFVNEIRITSVEMLIKFIEKCKPADILTFVILRDNNRLILPLILGKREVQAPDSEKPEEQGKLKASEHGYIGIYLEETEGRLRIMSVVENSPANKAGLQEGDLIDLIGDDEIFSLADLRKAFDKYYVGDTMKIVVVRSAMRKTFELKIAQRP